jgi:hypothetical protein
MHIVPSVIYLALRFQHGTKQLPRLGCDMAAGGCFVVCVVRSLVAELTVDIAREVPVKVHSGPRDSRVRSLGNSAKAVLVNFLEHKRSVISAKTPTRVIKWVRGAVEHRRSRWMKELGKIIVVAMDDNRASTDEGIADVSAVETIGRFPTNTLSESESEEADSGHEK